MAQRLVAQYLANRGWRSADTYLVLCFLCPIALVGPAEESTYLRMVGALFGGAIVTVHDGLLAVVIHRADYRDHAWGAALDQLASMVGANDLYCGMSMEFNDFNALSAYFAQASFSVRHAQESDGKRIQRFSDCYQMFLLDRLLAQTDPVCFCDPVLSSLWNEGKESRRELIRGYRAYLLSGRNVVASARALCVHRNTLVYRLNRLENMLGYSLKSLDEQTALIHLVSCTVLMRDELACKVQKSNG